MGASQVWRQAPGVLDYFAQLVAQDQGLPLLEAAATLGLDEDPGLDVQGVLTQVDALAQRLARRVPADAGALQRLRLLNRHFFSELGFAGNVNHFDDPANSWLHRVLETRRGIPISLALLYMELASHVGLRVQGVGFPGHFLVKLALPKGEAVLDPFNGFSLSRADLEERLAPLRQQQGLVGEQEVPLGLFLQAATPREILTRMLGNLRALWWAQGNWERALLIQERLVRLLPGDTVERRERGRLHAELGHWCQAAEDLAAYLSSHPRAPDADEWRQRRAFWLSLG